MNLRKLRKEENIIDFEDLEDNYDRCIERKLPDFLHGNNIVPVSRLLGYADGVIAACSALLIIPLRNVSSTMQPLAKVLGESEDAFAAFAIGIFVIFTIWESINIRSIVIKQLDDFLILFTIISMFFIASLPFSFSLMGYYPNEKVTAIIASIVLTLNELIDIIINFYAFANPGSLHIYLHKYSDGYLRYYRNISCLKSGITIIFFVLAGILSVLDYKGSWVCIALVMLLPWIRRILISIHRRIYGIADKVSCDFFPHFVAGSISKYRLRAFTDNVIAIVACLLTIDLTAAKFPLAPNVRHHGLTVELKIMGRNFVIFICMHLMVSMLWYTNSSLHRLIRRIDGIILHLQELFLMSACWIPLAAKFLHEYIGQESDDIKVAVRFASTFVFCAGLSNILILTYSIYRKEKLLHKWALKVSLKEMLRKHLYTILKLLCIPFWCVLIFLGTLGSGMAASIVMVVCVALSFATFFLLKAFFFKEIKKHIFHGDCDLIKKKRVLQYSIDKGVIENMFAKINVENEVEEGPASGESLEENKISEKSGSDGCENSGTPTNDQSENSLCYNTDATIGRESNINLLSDTSKEGHSANNLLYDESKKEVSEIDPDDNGEASEDGQTSTHGAVIYVNGVPLTDNDKTETLEKSQTTVHGAVIYVNGVPITDNDIS